MKIGFIGLGNMASAMIGGILGKGLYTREEILGADALPAAAELAKEKFGIAICEDNRAVVREADIIVFAVKPLFLQEVIQEIKDEVNEKKLLVSIVAGRSISWIEEAFAQKIRLVRCMPNTPAFVGEGCTAVCLNEAAGKEDEAAALAVMGSFGKASVIPERLMDAVVGVSGSSPAYVFMFIEAMADAAVLAGMPRAQAYEFAAQSVLGSAKMVLETGKHPAELKDMVCSPGGTTIEAVRVLEEKGFRAAVIDAVGACVEKSKNL